MTESFDLDFMRILRTTVDEWIAAQEKEAEQNNSRADGVRLHSDMRWDSDMRWVSCSDVFAIMRALSEQKKLLQQVFEVVKQQGVIMANFGAETLDLLKKIDTETTAAADRIAAKIDAAMAGTVEPATQDQIRAAIAAELARLRGLAADPANPIPPTPPVATAA